MKTSKTIKHNQRHPPKILHVRRHGNVTVYVVEGRDEDRYTVRREGAAFLCNCQAGRGNRNRSPLLCRHVQSTVNHEARGKFRLVQHWTDPLDAKKQKRRTAEFTTGMTPFWITYARPREEPVKVVANPIKVPRTARVSFLWDRWEPPDEFEAFGVKAKIRENGSWRESRIDLDVLLDLDGWVAGKMELVRGNEIPGLHRFEFDLRRT